MTVLEFRKTHRGTGAQAARLLRSMARGAAARAQTPVVLRPTPGTSPAGPDREGEDGPMPKSARLYVGAMAAITAVVAAAVVPEARWDQVNLLLFLALAVLQAVILLTSSFPRLAESPAVPASVAVQLAAVVLLTPAPAAAAAALGACALVLRPPSPRDRMILVICGVFLTSAVGGLVYGALHGSRPLTRSPMMPPALLPITVASLALSAVPAIMVGLLGVIGGRRRAQAAVREALAHVIPRNVAYSFVGLLAAVLWLNHAQVMATLVMLGPLLVTRWATSQYAEQRAAHEATVRTLVQAVEIKDLYTRGHSERVAAISEMIARRLGLDEERIAVLCYAAILHDVGKIGVPTRLLQKDGRLDAAEMAAIRVHPARGVEMVRDIAFLDEAYTAILYHHERMDGRGYPSGLAGEAIPRFARIIAVADAFDSMTSTRSYRPARPVVEALVELRNAAGTQFDPEMVDAIGEALAEAERAGRPWTGDGTFEARDGAGVGAAQTGTCAVTGTGTAIVGAAAASHGSKDEYDHDDPAFSVPGPAPVPSVEESAGSGDHNGSAQRRSTRRERR